MVHYTRRRPGVTLMEVMIATGIMAIAILAIMPLFVVGAVSMARAVNQSRSADHAANSDAVFRYYWKNAWIDQQYGGGVRPTRGIVPGTAAVDYEPFMIPLLDSSPAAPGVVRIPPTSSQPSFPVFVDPIGYQTQASFGLPNRLYVGGLSTLPARSTLLAAEADTTRPYRTRTRLTTLLDDMTWDKNGEPADFTGQLERGGRYNVAWLIQRPINSIPHEVHVVVCVYGGRSPTDTPSTEIPFAAFADNYYRDVDPKPNTITVPLGGQTMPNIRRGGWVAFSLQVQPRQVPPVPSVPYPTFDFYRVSAITDNSGDLVNPHIILEFEQPLRSYDPTTLLGYNAMTARLDGTVVFMDNLIEVFDRGMVSAQAITGR